ncbi:MAG: hypothetical protein GF346_11140 [Candidatus Eisenbacteria bacterium]|nr:hypothetical protein [Candidatus Latescibacterota bacterium]MBD3302990.1 hypothetical protein [Candidatus Eisenbacteria bacterium]
MKRNGDGDEMRREEFLRLLRELRRMLQSLDRLVEAALDLTYRLEGTTARQAQELEEILRAQARHGVHSIHFLPSNGDGRARVRVGDFPEFKLSQKLVHLLAILALDSAPHVDRFIGWKTRRYVAKELGVRMNRSYTPRDVSQAVHVLRAALRKREINPYLVDSTPQGVRLRLIASSDDRA